MRSSKNILFLARLFIPHIGGVEKQVYELSLRLIKLGYSVTVLTERYDNNVPQEEIIKGIKIIRINVLNIKYFGLIHLWFSLFKYIKIFQEANIVHAHSVYIWYWPFKLLFLKKPSYVTFHGWEGIYPIPKINIFIRRIDAFLANKNITISDYVEKHYGIVADKLMYTSVDIPKEKILRKSTKTIVYVGRLDEDTGLRKILKAISYLKKYKFQIEFCGDGSLKEECEKYGKVNGFVDPSQYYSKAFICISAGHTSILEAFTYKCLIVTTFNNQVKKDYLLMTPFKKWIIVENKPKILADKIIYYYKNPQKAGILTEGAYKWVKTQNWNACVNEYLDLWQVE